MASTENSDKRIEKQPVASKSLSIFSYLTGLAGMSFSITLAVWTYISLSTGSVLPPLLSQRSTLLFFLGMFILALQSSVAAWISGVISSRKAKELSASGYRRWRMGIYMGVFATVLLAITFVVLVSYSIHILVYHSGFNSRML
jgi:hypothetical protein